MPTTENLHDTTDNSAKEVHNWNFKTFSQTSLNLYVCNRYCNYANYKQIVRETN